MAFLLKNGAVFFHIPKTGGTWVKHVLEEMDLVQDSLGHPHSDWDRTLWHDKMHPDLKVARYLLRRAVRSPRAKPRMDPRCFKFCFIREPLVWYESFWRYMHCEDRSGRVDSLGGDPYKWHPFTYLDGSGSPDFNTFMHNVNKNRPGFVTEMYGWYIRPGMDFVGKAESLRQDVITVLSLMKVDFDPQMILSMPKQNETPSRLAKAEWDPKIKKETLRLEYAGYVRYGYPVEGIFGEMEPSKGSQAEMTRVG